MSDSFRDVTSVSWFGRIKRATIAIAGSGIGRSLRQGILAAGVIAAAAVYHLGRSRKAAVPTGAPSTGAAA